MFDFSVVPGSAVSKVLRGRADEVVDIVKNAYLSHEDGDTVDPDSYFLRFPEKPEARIIALPAFLGGPTQLAGIKWISSFPGNVSAGYPRASAVLVLNDYDTGYPMALLEGAGISANRTAASAALAAQTLGARPSSVGVVGAGVIARTICDYLASTDRIGPIVRCHDRDGASARSLVAYLQSSQDVDAVTCDLEEALTSDLVVLATTASQPYISTRFQPGQVVLNISLRDLDPNVLARENNVLDDVEHCLKADTSPHLLEKLAGGRDFVLGTLAQIMRGEVTLDANRATIFSPFGLGVLDIAVGSQVLKWASEIGEIVKIERFFGETTRW